MDQGADLSKSDDSAPGHDIWIATPQPIMPVRQTNPRSDGLI